MGLGGFAGGGALELRHVGDDAVDAGEAGGMGVSGGAQTEILGALLLAGPPGHADEETLVRGEAVDGLEGLGGGLLLPGEVGEESSAKIRDVFSAGEFELM